MQEIKCPKCGEVFQVDESGYAAIVKQVRDKEFMKEIQQREEALSSEKKLAIDLAVQHTASEKDQIIADLTARLRAGAADRDAALREAEAKQQLEMTRKDAQLTQPEGFPPGRADGPGGKECPDHGPEAGRGNGKAYRRAQRQSRPGAVPAGVGHEG